MAENRRSFTKMASSLTCLVPGLGSFEDWAQLGLLTRTPPYGSLRGFGFSENGGCVLRNLTENILRQQSFKHRNTCSKW